MKCMIRHYSFNLWGVFKLSSAKYSDLLTLGVLENVKPVSKLLLVYCQNLRLNNRFLIMLSINCHRCQRISAKILYS